MTRRLAHTSFDDNACVLLNTKGEMLGTRINGVVSSELSNEPNNKWAKILGLATKVSDLRPHLNEDGWLTADCVTHCMYGIPLRKSIGRLWVSRFRVYSREWLGV